ncbi:hypothetical protein ACOME3_000525 [Neoechinorhynchus agilis]
MSSCKLNESLKFNSSFSRILHSYNEDINGSNVATSVNTDTLLSTCEQILSKSGALCKAIQIDEQDSKIHCEWIRRRRELRQRVSEVENLLEAENSASIASQKRINPFELYNLHGGDQF